MNYRAIVAFVLLISAALPVGANELSGSPARADDDFAIGSAPAEPVRATERYYQFAQQRTPAVPPPPQCDANQRGTGTWTDGDIIPSRSVTGSCSQHFVCGAKPADDKRPNAACGFLVHHSDTILKNGQCSDQNCTKCVHEAIKDKCEWWFAQQRTPSVPPAAQQPTPSVPPVVAQQRTPAVPPAPQCDANQRGTGTWKGEIIPSHSVAGSCSERSECNAKPADDKRPNAACGFLVHHSDPILKNGHCSDQKCTTCVHEPVKEKCEWWLSK